jgi:hypothetical protein
MPVLPLLMLSTKPREKFVMNESLLDRQEILKAFGYFSSDLQRDMQNANVLISNDPGDYSHLKDLEINVKNNSCLYFKNKKKFLCFSRRIPSYHALLPHLNFKSPNLKPLWCDQNGNCIAGFYKDTHQEWLLMGLRFSNEIIRYRQGDPERVHQVKDKSSAILGFSFERSIYLFEKNILDKYKTIPFADWLGFFVAEFLARKLNRPLFHVLPNGAKGLLLLTGDDDQAYLEMYQKQINLIKDAPITYYLVYNTKHTKETLSNLPKSVAFGLHPDALDQPDQYDTLCKEQLEKIKTLTEQPIRTVRNHGFLNQGYLGHLPTWEACDLLLDLNYPGVDGTALNGSFLPMRVRQQNGQWSSHFSLLTLFGDGMIFALKMSEHHAVQRLRSLARQIENTYPGVIVLNLHPQNIVSTTKIHQAVLEIAKRDGWLIDTVENYLDWLLSFYQMSFIGKTSRDQSSKADQLMVRWPTPTGWQKQSWSTVIRDLSL